MLHLENVSVRNGNTRSNYPVGDNPSRPSNSLTSDHLGIVSSHPEHENSIREARQGQENPGKPDKLDATYSTPFQDGLVPLEGGTPGPRPPYPD